MMEESFETFLKRFLKRPITIKQEVEVLSLVMDGTINRNIAKDLLKIIMQDNLKRHDEIMAMSEQQILELVDKLGLRREPSKG